MLRVFAHAGWQPRPVLLSLLCEDWMRLGQATKKAGLSLVSALAFRYLCMNRAATGALKENTGILTGFTDALAEKTDALTVKGCSPFRRGRHTDWKSTLHEP